MLENDLKELILYKFKSIREFSNSIKIAYTTVDSILKRGISNANIVNVIKICDGLNIDVNELAAGRIKEKPSIINIDISSSEQNHIKKYRTLDEYGKDMVDTVLDKEYKRVSENKKFAQEKNSVKGYQYVAARNQKNPVTKQLSDEIDENARKILKEKYGK